jgi:hypothetical protein
MPIRSVAWVAVTCALVAVACSSTPGDAKEGVAWPASDETRAKLRIESWSLSVSEDGATVDVVGNGEDGERDRATLRYVTDADPDGAGYVLTLPDGEIAFRADGSVGRNTLVSDWTTARWEKFVLASLIDRAAFDRGGDAKLLSEEKILTLHPQVAGTGMSLVRPSATALTNGCNAAKGEAAYWSAAQGALGCTSPGDTSYRAQLPGYPYATPMVQAANFEVSDTGCAGSAQALARMGSATADCSTAGAAIQNASWGQSLLRNACLAGVAATSAVGGAATYWVCEGGAVVGSGAVCTAVAPGVGTVGCGAAGGVVAQPVCAGGGLAVAAGAAAAGLSICNVVAPTQAQAEAQPAAPATPSSLRDAANAIPGEHDCQEAFSDKLLECEIQLTPPPGWFGPFHRLFDGGGSMVDKCALTTCELWGKGFRGGFPCAQAFQGPLPPGRQGFEFYTDVASASHPSLARWCAIKGIGEPPTNPKIKLKLDGSAGAIQIAITKVQG